MPEHPVPARRLRRSGWPQHPCTPVEYQCHYRRCYNNPSVLRKVWSVESKRPIPYSKTHRKRQVQQTQTFQANGFCGRGLPSAKVRSETVHVLNQLGFPVGAGLRSEVGGAKPHICSTGPCSKKHYHWATSCNGTAENLGEDCNQIADADVQGVWFGFT